MRYRHAVPYPARYLIALLAWTALMAGALILKFFLIPCIPIIFVMSNLGTNHTQSTAQYNASLADLFVYGWPKFPKADWRRLFCLRSHHGSGQLIQ